MDLNGGTSLLTHANLFLYQNLKSANIFRPNPRITEWNSTFSVLHIGSSLPVADLLPGRTSSATGIAGGHADDGLPGLLLLHALVILLLRADASMSLCSSCCLYLCCCSFFHVFFLKYSRHSTQSSS
jgi:hypothetical protein